MTQPGSSRIAIVVGRKKSGKSTLVRLGLAKRPRWIVWDLRGEYASVPGSRLWRDVREFGAHVAGGGDIAREVFACPVAQFEAWCRFAFNAGGLLVVIEELGRYCSASFAPPFLLDLFDRSRHARLDLVCVSPRISGIPASLRGQADELVTFRATSPPDLLQLRDWLGLRTAERVRRLAPHRFLRLQT